jgi:hypothetical protein
MQKKQDQVDVVYRVGSMRCKPVRMYLNFLDELKLGSDDSETPEEIEKTEAMCEAIKTFYVLKKRYHSYDIINLLNARKCDTIQDAEDYLNNH